MQIFPLRLIPDNTKIDFMGLQKFSYYLSVILILGSFILLATCKLNFGIDFAGGITIEARTAEKPDIPHMRELLNKLDLGEVSLQNFGTDQDILIKLGSSSNSEEELMQNIEKIKTALAHNIKYDIEYRKIDFVGPQVGSYLIISGIEAMILAFLAIMVYIWFRFEWQFGIGILLALVHDVIIALGFMSATGLDFNLSSIAAILTIIGYSVNDSVVIYDRIRENLRKYHKRSVNEVINISINETLSRSILTVFTTLIANLALIIYGGEAIRSFSILIFTGIIIGTYSSIYISAPLLTIFGLNKKS